MIKIEQRDAIKALSDYPDKFFDLCIADPPYGIGWGNVANNFKRKSSEKWKSPKEKFYTLKDWDNQRPEKSAFDDILRVSKKCIIWGGNYFTDLLPPSGGWLVWDKGVSENMTLSKAELAWHNCKNSVDIIKYLWSGFRKCEVVDRIHPTQKPVKLYEFCISKFSKPGDTILDPYLGSGSSAIAAYRTRRAFVGYEIDEEYYTAAVKRLDKERQQLKLF